MRKITPEEIEGLYSFTRQHYVEYYDVQTELVDHMASAMDSNWEKEPELSFDENLKREFRKFGIYGFSDIVEKKVAAMEKRYLWLIWEEVKIKLKHPRMMVSVLLLFSLFLLLLKIPFGIYVILGFLLIFVLSIGVLFFRKTRGFKKKKSSGEKVYLLETIIMNSGGCFSLCWLPIHLFNVFGSSESMQNVLVQVPIAFFLTFLLLACYICFHELPKKKDEILQKIYPERKFLE